MVLGIPLEEAIAKVGHTRGMRNHEVVRALGDSVLVPRSIRAEKPLYDPSILRIKGPKSRWHLVFLKHGKVYDPGIPFPAPTFELWEEFVIKQKGWRVVSQFPLRLPRGQESRT